MKKLLLFALALALAACGSAPVVQQVVVVVTATPQVLDIEQRLIADITGLGERYDGSDNRGENNCGEDRCIHFSIDGANGTSVYVTNGKLVSILSAMSLYGTDNSERLGSIAGAILDKYYHPSSSEWSCLTSAEIGDRLSCGRFGVSVIVEDGMLYVIYYVLGNTNTGLEA